MLAFLPHAEARRVGTGNIDDQIGDFRGQSRDSRRNIGDRIIRTGIDADIDADDGVGVLAPIEVMFERV